MNTSEKEEQLDSTIKNKVLKRPRRCEICGAIVSYFNMRRHLKTKKHIDSVFEVSLEKMRIMFIISNFKVI